MILFEFWDMLGYMNTFSTRLHNMLSCLANYIDIEDL